MYYVTPNPNPRWLQQENLKGQDRGFAYCGEVALVPWEASTWNVSHGLEWEVQPSMRVQAGGAAAEEIARAAEQVDITGKSAVTSRE